jgi:hypothetical protein
LNVERVILIGATPLVKTFILIPFVGSHNGSHNGIWTINQYRVPVYAINKELSVRLKWKRCAHKEKHTEGKSLPSAVGCKRPVPL